MSSQRLGEPREAFAAADEGIDAGSHGLGDGLRTLDDGDGDGADRRQGFDAFGLDPATDRDARHARRLGTARDAKRGLAEGRLRVDPALAGDDEVGAREPGVMRAA